MKKELQNRYPGIPSATLFSLLWKAIFKKKSACLLVPFTITHTLTLKIPIHKGKAILLFLRQWMLAPLMKRTKQTFIVSSLLEKTRLMQWYWICEEQIYISSSHTTPYPQPLSNQDAKQQASSSPTPTHREGQPTEPIQKIVFASNTPTRDGLALLIEAWSLLPLSIELVLFLPSRWLKHYQSQLSPSTQKIISWNPLDLWKKYTLSPATLFVWPSLDDLHSPFPLDALHQGAFLLLSPYSTLCEKIPLHQGQPLPTNFSLTTLVFSIKNVIKRKQNPTSKNIFVKKTL